MDDGSGSRGNRWQAVVFRTRLAVAVLGIAAFGVALASAAPAWAATFTVNSTAVDDDGSCSAPPPTADCTLPEAIAAANATGFGPRITTGREGGTIRFGDVSIKPV